MDMTDERQLRTWGYWAALIVGALGVAYAGPFLAYGPIGHGLGLSFRVAAMTISSALAVGWAIGFAVLIYRNTDEFGQQASRFAWYWGCAFGLAAALPLYVFVVSGGLGLIEGVTVSHLTPAEARARVAIFRMGFLIPVLTQMAGFAVVRTWWWAAKR
jgi:hypothetical protein